MRLSTVDVFSEEAYGGNPVAVVHGADALGTSAMQRFARWTNLSETTFLLEPTDPDADYRVRIFTPSVELPFAGHPTLGTAHAWLEAGGRPAEPGRVGQECGAGVVELRRGEGGRLALRAPPLLRSGPLDAELRDRVVRGLGVAPAAVVDAAWVDNGPGWVGLLLDSADTVLRLRPGPLGDLAVGVIGPLPAGEGEQWEVRAWWGDGGIAFEDPVTGSLNASLAQWLIPAGRAAAPYVARQGTALGRSGRVHISTDADGAVWVGGNTATLVAGEVRLPAPG